MDDTMLSPPRSLAFLERMRVTYALYLMGFPMLGGWLMTLWSSGATVSFSRIGPRHVKLHIENEKKGVTVDFDIMNRHVTSE